VDAVRRENDSLDRFLIRLTPSGIAANQPDRSVRRFRETVNRVRRRRTRQVAGNEAPPPAMASEPMAGRLCGLHGFPDLRGDIRRLTGQGCRRASTLRNGRSRRFLQPAARSGIRRFPEAGFEGQAVRGSRISSLSSGFALHQELGTVSRFREKRNRAKARLDSDLRSGGIATGVPLAPDGVGLTRAPAVHGRRAAIDFRCA